MNEAELKAAIIDLFKSGKATPEQWDELTACLIYLTEHEEIIYPTAIMATVEPEPFTGIV